MASAANGNGSGNHAAVIKLLQSFIEESKKERDELRKEIKDVETNTERRISALSRDTRDEIERVGQTLLGQIKEIRVNQRTNPGFWIQAGGLIAVFAGMAAGLIIMSQKVATGPLANEIANVRHMSDKHMAKTMHHEAGLLHAQHEERFKRLFKSIDELKESMQRETSLNEERTRARLERIEKKVGISLP